MRKIKYVILPLLLALFFAVGSALAAWTFGSAGRSENSLTGIRDDILENYNIKKAGVAETNTVKEYTMYLYPSTLYLNDYIGYLEGQSGAVLPEEKYGYIEASVGADGKAAYNYAPKGGGDSSYLADVARNDTYTMANANNITGMYYNVYKDDPVWFNQTGSAPLEGGDPVLSGLTDSSGESLTVTVGSASVAADSKFLYGDPDEASVVYSDSTTGVTLQDTTGERHNWRNLHYYDRFGYWSHLAKGAGRYLPVKITVDENFTNTFFNKVAMTPLADMGDPHDWFVYSFSCWAYVAFSKNSGSYTAPYFATDDFLTNNKGTNYVNKDGTLNPSLSSFCPTMVSQYFDIIKSAETFADGNGVIRLFPKFSNGKGYSSGSVKDGGGDAVKAVPTPMNADGTAGELSVNDQHELFMFYSTETASITQGSATATVHVSVLPNVNFESYYSLDFKVAITSYTAGWPGGWTDVYSFGQSATGNTYNKNIPQTLSAYGYGMYNLYLFMTQVATAESDTDFTSPTSDTDPTSALEKLRQALVNKSSDEKTFPSLKGKNLLPIATAYAGKKSFMLVGEKVREAKFIGDLNFGSTNGAKDSNESEISQKYLNTDKSFRLINRDLKGYTSDETSVDSIQDEFPYCYILQNVDFTESTTQYCQMRFQRAYREDLHFADTTEYKYKKVEFDSTVYGQAFGNYFELVSDMAVSGYDGKQQVIKLKNEEMRGIYDFIMVFRSARATQADGDRAYNIGLFAYRHTNIFLKIYDGDPTGKAYYAYKDNDPKNGVVETDSSAYGFVDHSDPALFDASYPIGVSIKNKDENEKGNGTGTYLDACVNNAVTDKGYDPAKVKLYDHVTGAEVARYEAVAADAAEEGITYLEYGGKKYKLVINAFKIRKNYIFYIKEEG